MTALPRRMAPAIRFLRLCVLPPVLAGCLFETHAPDPAAAHTLAYRLEAPAGGGCRVTVRIDAWPADEAKIFQAPVYYPDNPVCPVPGLRAADLDIRDGRGAPLAARDSAGSSPADGNLILLPAAARSFSYPVDLAPGNDARFGLPAPGLAPGTDAVDGAYFFLLPVLAADIAARWRAPARISLDIESPGRVSAGFDAHQDLASPYELMFVRGAFDPLRMVSLSASGRELRVYALSDPALDLEAYAGLLADCMRWVADSLLPVPGRVYSAGECPAFWGIEGMGGHWFNAGAVRDRMVHTHEAIHSFLGVRHGDLEDPWWKEGMTNYLGWLLPFQAGHIPDTVFAAQMLADLDTARAVREVPLSSPSVRTRLYLPFDTAWKFQEDPEGYTLLVYGKGSQASMILDRWLLERSGGRNSVFDLVRALVLRHGNAFTRRELAAETSRLAGAPAEAFLSKLLDSPGALPPDSLRSTYRALLALGRFAPGGGRSPVPALGPLAAKRGAAAAAFRKPPGGKL